jgi:hypothetical protein
VRRQLLAIALAGITCAAFAFTAGLTATGALAQTANSFALSDSHAAATHAADAPDVSGVPAPVGGSGVGGDGGSGTVNGSGGQTDGGGNGGAGNGGSSGGANNCIGCTYQWVAFCDPALANAGCGANACPPGFLLETLMITDPRLPAPIAGGTECRSPSGATPAQVRQAVFDEFSQLLTTAHPSQQPAGGGVVNLPTLFSTNTPVVQMFNETLLGVQVTLNVNASWTWDFGDGTNLTSSDPGGAYPISSLNHVYLVSGSYVVALTTNWTGTYSMAGGPAAVIPGGPIPRASLPFPLEIHEAHSVLVTG